MLSDRIARLVLAQHASCAFRPSNDAQHTVLAAFVLEHTAAAPPHDLKVVALATGAKCLPTDRYPVRGDALHDSHAEVLARRALVRWLYDELQRASTAAARPPSPWLARGADGRWALDANARLHMYISTVPCGDASMRFLAASQDPRVAALKDAAPPAPPPQGAAARGRDTYALHGVLRTKPGRADAPPTRCMACSDKLAAWAVLGVQGALAAQLLAAPLYVRSLTLGAVPARLRDVVRADCTRALYARLKDIGDLPDGFHLATPSIHFTSTAFKYSKDVLQARAQDNLPPSSSNESLSWFADSPSGHEVIVNGVRRGIGAKLRGFEKYRPRTCKLQLFRLHLETLRMLGEPEIAPSVTYFQAKKFCTAYQSARSALKGPAGPFAGWVVSGEQWESFNAEGDVVSSQATGDSESVRTTNISLGH